MAELTVVDHPLIIDKLTRMRDENTPSPEFRELLNQMTYLLAFEATRDLPTREVEIKTPVAQGKFPILAVDQIVLAPILRAGVGMVEGMLKVIPEASIGYIGMYRDEETFEPVEYMCKLPKLNDQSVVIVLDPMLATGGSAKDAIDMLKRVGAKNIRMVNVVATPKGIETIQTAHPDVDIYVAKVDEGLNEKAYIVPGLGDAGDRIFGTI